MEEPAEEPDREPDEEVPDGEVSDDELINAFCGTYYLSGTRSTSLWLPQGDGNVVESSASDPMSASFDVTAIDNGSVKITKHVSTTDKVTVASVTGNLDPNSETVTARSGNEVIKLKKNGDYVSATLDYESKSNGITVGVHLTGDKD